MQWCCLICLVAVATAFRGTWLGSLGRFVGTSRPTSCLQVATAEGGTAAGAPKKQKPKKATVSVPEADDRPTEKDAIFYPKAVDPTAPLSDQGSEEDMLYDLFMRQISELNEGPATATTSDGLFQGSGSEALRGADDEGPDPLDVYSAGVRGPLASRKQGALVPSKHNMVERPIWLEPNCPIEFVYKRRVVMGNFVSRRSTSGGGLTVTLASGEPVAIDVSQIVSSWDQLADETAPSTAQQWAQVASEALTILGNLSPRKSDLQEFWQLVSQRSSSLPVDSMDLGVYIFQERRFRSWINPYHDARDSAVRALSAAQRYAAALLLFHDDFHFRRRPSKLLTADEAKVMESIAEREEQERVQQLETGSVGGASYSLEDLMSEEALRRFKRSPASKDNTQTRLGVEARAAAGTQGEEDSKPIEREYESGEDKEGAVLVLEGAFSVLPENTVQFREIEVFLQYYQERVTGAAIGVMQGGQVQGLLASTAGQGQGQNRAAQPFRAAGITRILRALEVYSMSPASLAPPQQIKALLKRLGKPSAPDGARMALREMNLRPSVAATAGASGGARVAAVVRSGPSSSSSATVSSASGAPGGFMAGTTTGVGSTGNVGPTPWPAEVLAAAERLAQEQAALREVMASAPGGLPKAGKRGIAGRMDYRANNEQHPIICIDGSKAVFLDDAFSLSPETGEVLVHVVDVSGALRRYDVLQQVAMERVSSTFLPSGPLHMLPPQALSALKLSTTGCNEVITVALSIDAEDGRLLGVRVFPSVVGPVFSVDIDTADEILDSVNSGDRDGWSFRLGYPEAVVRDLVTAQRLVQRVIERQPWVDKSFSSGQQTSFSLNKRTGRYKQTSLDKTAGNRMLNALLTLYSNSTVEFCTERGVSVPLAWENRDRVDGQLVRRFATQPLRNWLAQLQQQQLRAALKMELPLTRKDCAMAVAHHNSRRKQMSSLQNAGRDVVSFESLESHCAALLASGQDSVVLNAEGQGRGGSVKLVDFKVMGTVMADVPRGAMVKVRVVKVRAETRTVILDLVDGKA